MDDLRWNNTDLLPEKVVDIHVEEPKKGVIHKAESMPQKKWTNNLGYDRSMYDDVRRIIWEALIDHEEDMLNRLIADKRENVVLEFFQEAWKRALDNVHMPILKFIGQVAVKISPTGGDEELLQDKIYKLAVSQYCTQSIACYLIK